MAAFLFPSDFRSVFSGPGSLRVASRVHVASKITTFPELFEAGLAARQRIEPGLVQFAERS